MEDALNMAMLAGAMFHVLADSDTQVAREYGVFDLLDDGVSAPATFIVGSDTTILWRHVGQNIADRPLSGEILEKVKELRG